MRSIINAAFPVPVAACPLHGVILHRVPSLLPQERLTSSSIIVVRPLLPLASQIAIVERIFAVVILYSRIATIEAPLQLLMAS